jgi:hypothetical protein
MRGEDKGLPPLVTEQDRAVYGEVLLKLIQEPGWSALVSLIERHRQNIGSASLDDSPKMHKYWMGRRDEVDAILQEISELAGEAAELLDVEPEVEQAFLGRRVTVTTDDGSSEET